MQEILIAKKTVDRYDSIGYRSPNKLLDYSPFQPTYHKAHTSARNLVDAASSIDKDTSFLHDEKAFCAAAAGDLLSVQQGLNLANG